MRVPSRVPTSVNNQNNGSARGCAAALRCPVSGETAKRPAQLRCGNTLRAVSDLETNGAYCCGIEQRSTVNRPTVLTVHDPCSEITGDKST